MKQKKDLTDLNLSIIFPTFFEINDSIHKSYNALETRTFEVAKLFANLGVKVNIIAPRGSHTSQKNITVLNGDVRAWDGHSYHPYDGEKNQVETNLDILKNSDAILEDSHFGYLKYLKSINPSDFPKVVYSFDHHCFTAGVRIRAVSRNGKNYIRKIADLENEHPKLIHNSQEINGEWFKEPLKSKLYKVKLHNNFEINAVTADHLHLTNNGLKRTDELSENDYLPISLSEFGGDVGNYDLGWLMGFIGAEGSIIDGEGVYISQQSSEEGRNNIMQCEYISKQMGHYAHSSQNHRGELTLAIARTFVPIVKSFIGGHNALTKHLMNKVWNTTKDFRSGMWEGWHDGDRSGDGIATYSKNLADDLTILLRSIGKLSAIYSRISSGYSNHGNLCYTVRPYKLNDNKGYTPSYIKKDSDSAKVWVQIKEINEVKSGNTIFVYDYNINSDQHLFELANGIITHNCDQLQSLPNYPQNIICVSKWQMSALREKFKNLNHNFYQAYSGLILENYPEYNLKDKQDNLYLFLARFSTVKAPHIIIELARENPNDEFVLMGDTLFSNEPHYARELKLISDSMKNVKIIFNASYDEKIQYLQKATGLLHPGSWHEPLGWDMLEGLYHGCKVMAFDRGSVREIYQHEKHGLIIPFSDNENQNIEFYKRGFRQFKKLDIKPEVCKDRILSNFDFKKHSFGVYNKVLFD